MLLCIFPICRLEQEGTWSCGLGANFPQKEGAALAAGIQIGLEKATGFRSLSSRQACVMLRSINYMCYASTGDVLSLLELCRQSPRVFQCIQPSMFRPLGFSPVYRHPRHLSSPGGGGCPHTSCPRRSWCGCFPCPCTDLSWGQSHCSELLLGSDTLPKAPLCSMPFFPAKTPISHSPGISAERQLFTPP